MYHFVDDLVLLKCIGKGNFGEVFLTQKNGRQELYATKKMDRSLCESPQNYKRLLREIELLKIINHPNIVKLYDLKRTANHWYLITEYCNGGSLLSNLKKYIATYYKPFSEEIVQHLMKQIVSAINYLHFNKIIHRDLKLDNILLNFPSEYDKNSLNMMNATIKIIDFGFAKRLNGPFTFTALGTPINMDPQILEDIKTGIPNTGYNEQVDIWSLGTLCYEMLVGHSAFSAASMDELFQKVKIGKYSLPINLSKEVVSFINGMLQQDLNKRLNANQLLNHEFLLEHPSHFQPIDMRQLHGSRGHGGVINMKSASSPQDNNYNNNYFLQFWAIFNQPGLYRGVQNQVQQVQQDQQIKPVKQLPSQQQYDYMNQPHQYYVNQNMGGYYSKNRFIK